MVVGLWRGAGGGDSPGKLGMLRPPALRTQDTGTTGCGPCSVFLGSRTFCEENGYLNFAEYWRVPPGGVAFAFTGGRWGGKADRGESVGVVRTSKGREARRPLPVAALPQEPQPWDGLGSRFPQRRNIRPRCGGAQHHAGLHSLPLGPEPLHWEPRGTSTSPGTHGPPSSWSPCLNLPPESEVS